MSRPPRLSRRALWGIVFLMLGFAALAAAAWGPFLYRAALAPQLDDAGQMLALLEAKIKAAGAKEKPPLVSAADAPRAFVEGRTAGLATAAVQRIAVDVATASGLTVEKVQPLPAEQKDAIATLRLQVDMSGSLDAFRAFLIGLEGGAPLLFVKEAHFAAPAITPSQDGENGASEGQPSDNLQASVTIEGYGWWGEP